jgi:hypothetical protein
MDAHFHYLNSSGVHVGRDVKHVRVLIKELEDEEKLWRSGVMGTKTSKALQNAVFFTRFGKCLVFVAVLK